MRTSVTAARWLAWPLIVAVLLTALVAAPVAAAADDGADAVHGTTVPGRIVVRWVDGTDAASKSQLRDLHGAWTLDSQEPFGLELMGVRHDAVDAVVAALSRHPAVRFAEPELVIESATDDPGYGELWGLHNTGQSGGTADMDVDAPEAWAVTRGSSDVVVAVIDTGVQIDHPDLAANIWVNADEIAGNGLDDDSNGYIDDVNGWDFKYGNNSVYDSASEDDHGTHVAGTIAAVADNQTGVVGVAPNVKIMPLKFLGGSDGSGTSYDASLAVAYAAANGARIINASWGGGGGTALQTAIKDATGVAFVAAAGNSGVDIDATPYYPASWAKDSHAMGTVLSVASITRTGVLSSFSNYGLLSVDVAAPGSSIYSTLPTSTYGTYSGTSMAAPHASGVAALIASLRPDLDGAGLVAAVKSGVAPLTAANGKTTTGGLLNAYGSVEPYHAPGAPTDVTAVAGNGEATVTWTAPTTGGDPTSYAVTVSPTTGVTGDTTRTVTAPATSLLFDGLTNGTAYSFTVTATNAGGTSPASTASAAVTPSATVPAAPTGLTATNGDGFVQLGWTAPSDDGGSAVTSYSVTASSDPNSTTDDVTRTVTAPTTSLTFDGLTNGTAYTFAIRAVNAVGASAALTSDAITPRVLTAPGAPTGLTIVPDHESATAGWTAPTEDGGRAITGYVVTASLPPLEGQESGTVVATVETAATSVEVTGLTAGTTYTFAVAAKNEIGTGTATTADATTTAYTVPGAPTGVTATAGDGSATVTWTAPTDDGGQTITGYRVTADPGGATATTSSTSVAVSGLTNGTAYTFTVTATNAVGTGPASAPSAAVTPTAPPAPAPPPSGGGGGGGGGGGFVPAPAPSPTAPGSTSGTVEEGGTVTTDPDGTGATTDAPAQTAVTSPVAGDVTVEMTDVQSSAPTQWSFLGVQVVITAPVATPEQPLALEFKLDGSLDTRGVVPFRNGVPVPDCLGSTIAKPDPCVSARSASGDDVVLTVLTSRASTWNFGHPTVACPDGRVAAAAFTDVSGVHAASIECLAWWEVTSGITATTYGSAATVRRDQMASFIARALTEAGVTLPRAGDRFDDVAGGTHGAAIEQLAAAGIVGGVDDRRYGAAGQVTRAQMATFLAKAVEYATGAPLPDGSGAFEDLGTNVHAAAIERVAAAGLVRGTGTATFSPGRPVTRAQMASFLVNLLDLLVERGIARPPVQ